MIEQVTLYGKPSYQYEIIKHSLINSISKANLNIQLREIQDISSFINLELKKIPAIKYKREIKNLESENVHDFINEVNQWILKKQNYGSMKKILVPIDYSETAENALIYAKGLGVDLNGIIKVLHVFHPTAQKYSSSDYDKLLRIEKEKFQNHISQLNKAWIGKKETNILIDSEFKNGLAGNAIIEESENLKNGLIVMGTRKNNQLQKEWLGSVSTELIKKSAAPLLIVPSVAAYTGLKNILICTNDTDLDIEISSEILNLIKTNEPNIHLVHVGENDNYHHQSILKHWQSIYKSEKIQFNKIVHRPDARVLENYCDIYDIDLVVTGRTKKNFFLELIHTSFSRKLAIHSSVPLLVLNRSSKE